MVGRHALRFHWGLPSVREAPEFGTHLEVCREAERSGIESVLVPFGHADPDPFAWSAALGRRARRIRFLIAVRSGVSSPTYVTQQVNTLAAITGGRVAVRIISGWRAEEQRAYGDPVPRAGWYARTDEFWQVCHGLWRGEEPVTLHGAHYRIEGARTNAHFVSADGRARPEIYLDDDTAGPAPRHADCLVFRAPGPGQSAERVAAGLDAGAGIALEMTAGDPAGGLADAILAHADAGVTQFLLSAAPRPNLERLRYFAREVLPLVRARERPAVAAARFGPSKGDTHR